MSENDNTDEVEKFIAASESNLKRIRDEQMQKLERRKQLRADNHLRPRCACCEADMLVLSARDVFTEEELLHHPMRDDFRRGDILCFACWNRLTLNYDEQPDWGRA
jgi:hypothetical protein